MELGPDPVSGKPVVVRRPPGTPPGFEVGKSALTLALPFVVNAAIAFSLLRMEWHVAVQPPPRCTNESSCAYVFAAAEYVGGILMVIFIALIFRLTLTRTLVEQARQHAEQGRTGRMEGHAQMDMSVTSGSLLSRLFSARGITATSHY